MGVFNDNLTQLNDTQEKIYTYKLKTEQEKEAKRAHAEKIKDIKTNIEAATLDFFNDYKMGENYTGRADLVELKKIIKSLYEKDSSLTEYEKNSLALFASKQYFKLQKNIDMIEKKKQEPEEDEPREQKKKNPFFSLELVTFCVTFLFCWYFMNQ